MARLLVGGAAALMAALLVWFIEALLEGWRR
jgi:hypothetical protein